MNTYSASDFFKAALYGGLVFGGLFVGLGFLQHGKAALDINKIGSAIVSGGVVFAGTTYFYNKHLASAAALASATPTVAAPAAVPAS